eukprot:TRINITY_DN21602_c0_g1_i2.p1 TRINITY_DN21602_c0_g1~~TRINITY_DN21602_c0_g1_i2.p1  ORF type:complete len:159 (+),score=44.95 TRINITY_DN21602_c0_g1_i2:43-477(+)
MKKKIIILIFLSVTALALWAFRNSGEDSKLGQLVPVSEEQQTKLIAAVNQALEIYNTKGGNALRRIFSAGNTPPEVWKLAGIPDPVAESIDTLISCGKGLRLENIEIKKRYNSTSNNHWYIVTANINELGDREKKKKKKKSTLR